MSENKPDWAGANEALGNIWRNFKATPEMQTLVALSQHPAVRAEVDRLNRERTQRHEVAVEPDQA